MQCQMNHHTLFACLILAFVIPPMELKFIEELREYLLEDTTKTSTLFESIKPDKFDFIVVGAGSAGSVIASRLSEHPNVTVLVLEAGEEENLLNEIPSEPNTLLASKYNWNYGLEPQENMCYGMVNRICTWPRGKALGGSSSINDMVYTRGNRRDYDKWAELGNTGWSYYDVLPYFLKSEQSHLENVDEEYHNTQGLLSVDVSAFEDPVTNAFLETVEKSGQKILDYNGASQMGFSRIQGTIKNGRRASTATAFLYPFTYRENLYILKSSMVTKILTDDTKRAYGVVYTKHSKEYAVYASKEVILSAGVIGSPQLLMLSGIGPKEDLERLDIPSVQDLPVGQTLYDHIVFPGLIYTHNATNDIALNISSFLDWTFYGKGIFTTLGGTRAIGYISTDDTTYPNIDIEVLFGLGSIGGSDIPLKVSNFNQNIIDNYFKPLRNLSVFSIMSELMHPKSVGYLKLRSNDPYDYPIINAKYYSDPEDLKIHVSGIRFILKLTYSEPFKKINAQLYDATVPGCEQEVFNSDAYWICALKHIAMTSYHPSGSCKMGPATDPMAVVDSNLKVYGIKSLRVADSSIFPKIITGHTNAPSIMVGEKAADLVKQEWFNDALVTYENCCKSFVNKITSYILTIG